MGKREAGQEASSAEAPKRAKKGGRPLPGTFLRKLDEVSQDTAARAWARLGKLRNEAPPFRLLLAVTGSEDAIEVEKLVAKIQQVQDEVLEDLMVVERDRSEKPKIEYSRKFTSSIEVKVIATEARRKLLLARGSAGSSTGLSSLEKITLLSDEDEWRSRAKEEDPLHVELRKWADMMLVAPLSANTLAKVANGMCDNLITCVARAWDFKGAPDNLEKPLVVAPAMNACMWEHPITKKQLKALDDLGVWIVPPKTNYGSGRPDRYGARDDIGPMAPTDVLCDAIQHCFLKHLLEDFARGRGIQPQFITCDGPEYVAGWDNWDRWDKEFGGGPRWIEYISKYSGKRGFHRYVLQRGHPRVRPLFPSEPQHPWNYYDFTHRETSDDDY